MPRRRRRRDRSTRPGFIRRHDKQGRNRAWVYDLTEDRYCEVTGEGRVTDERLAPGDIPVEVANEVYEEGT